MKSVRLVFVLSVAILLSCGGSEETKQDIVPEVGIDVLAEGVEEETTQPEETSPQDVDFIQDLQPEADLTDVPFKCQNDSDCKDSGTLAQCEKMVCVVETGECVKAWDEQCCLDNQSKPWLAEGFENGLPAGWSVNVPLSNKGVTWSVDTKRRAAGTKSLYFGDPACHTYYNGALDTKCKPIEPPPPQAGPTWVKGAVTTSTITIPKSKGTPMATFYVWIEAQPMIPMIDPQPDVFKVFAVINPGTNEEVQELFTSVSLLPHPKNTDGNFVFVAANLKDFEGKTIALRFSFDSLGADDNYYEGVYVDEVRIFAACNPVACDPGSQCASDGVVCTSDKCVTFSNKPTKGYCAYPIIPECEEPMCTEENYLTKCPPPTDSCMELAGCVNFKCVYEPKPQCCTTEVALSAGFDDGSLGGFSIWTLPKDSNVKWQVSSFRSTSGGYSLYYGNLVSKTYDNGQGNYGEATSPAVEILASKYPFAFLTFNLFLSTEFDDTDPENYYNPVGVDLFQVLVVQNLGKANEVATTVWSSHNVKGTTNKEFIPVGIDLSEYSGKKIWIRFSFNSGDEKQNQYEGVYIDDVKLELYNCEPRRDCKGIWDCGFDDYCRKGSCVTDICVPDPNWIQPAGCCVSSQECDTGDPCYIYACVNHKCYSEFMESQQCCKEDTFVDYSIPGPSSFALFSVVDNSEPNGGPEVTWRYSEGKAHSLPGSLYFGSADETTYDNGGTVKSSLTTPEIQVPTYGFITLNFYLFIDMEQSTTYNDFYVEVVPMEDQNNPVKVVSKANIPTEFYKQWFELGGIDLKDFKGKTIKLRFVVDSRHHDDAPGGAGLWIDDIQIRKFCPQ